MEWEKIKNQSSIVFKLSLLKNLSPLERYEFLQLCHRRKFHSGEFIFFQDDPGTGMYIIEEGKVRLSVSDSADNKEKESFYRDISSPAEFGTMSIGYETRRLYSARCLTDCILLGFFKPDFETLKRRHPETSLKFLEAVSTKAMKQLELTMKKLKEEIGAEASYKILLEAQYRKTD
ncbi:MAG TPA: cyclic nucleotide-binding domain-containing protein [Balneolaceae bacterium]|nr:cyclic nucleotide-binding domain-containing protein [Balneolaceae bacterium]